jgi:putative endonuclease
MFHYVYILVSESEPDRHYIGSTSDLNARLAAHNAGRVSHTSKYKPWSVESAIAFERYLKSGSGREFARRHF